MGRVAKWIDKEKGNWKEEQRKDRGAGISGREEDCKVKRRKAGN